LIAQAVKPLLRNRRDGKGRTGDCQLGDFSAGDSDIDRKKIPTLIVKNSHSSGVQFPVMLRSLVPGEIDGIK
jgi:hypothetical protein